ncbi:class I SAM-dependent methyltransferase [Paenibacillus hamazuiensis]|uniref:class I SAM-dependent methyltransferase n=1 Tax=Paenibacillus hamazuiensis TaxID=2936508 RepID=UPI00200BADAD|nr:phospholipid methyltransferase [Paenibacillus hamazuiensis]
MNMTASTWQKCLFLYKFIRFPKQIGSVTPSSKALAKKMVSSVPWDKVRHVAELGAGTGAVTKFIHEAGYPDTKVFLFEKEPVLRSRLAGEYPEYYCFPDAVQLDTAIRSKGVEQLDCVISGLPFANFPQEIRDAIIGQVVKTLKPGGLFVAFQYSLQMKKQLARHFHIEDIHFVMGNVPPAFVYVCRKKERSSR